MSNRYFQGFACDRQTILFAGQFATDGSGDPGAVSGPAADLVSVAHNGEGDYTLTISDTTGFQTLHAFFQLVNTTESDTNFELHTVTPASGTVRFLSVTAGVATDVDSGVIHFLVVGFKGL